MKKEIPDSAYNYFINIFDDLKTNSKILASDAFIQHGDTSVLMHSIMVAYFSYCFALKHHNSKHNGSPDSISSHYNELIRGALLHDYFLYDWHVPSKSHNLHGFKHPGFACKNAERDIKDITLIEENIIKRHMFPLTPIPPACKEAWVVCLVDKLCSTYETFTLEKHFHIYDHVKNKLQLNNHV